jgi:hypothetical protein
MQQATQYLKEYWQWLATPLAIPIIGLLWTRFGKSKPPQIAAEKPQAKGKKRRK